MKCRWRWSGLSRTAVPSPSSKRQGRGGSVDPAAVWRLKRAGAGGPTPRGLPYRVVEGRGRGQVPSTAFLFIHIKTSLRHVSTYSSMEKGTYTACSRKGGNRKRARSHAAWGTTLETESSDVSAGPMDPESSSVRHTAHVSPSGRRSVGPWNTSRKVKVMHDEHRTPPARIVRSPGH
jgi:hypothetical protein